MNILGLHFGHDGAVAVIIDGRPKVVLLTERITRVKHAVGIDRALIEAALADAGLTVADIDYCAVTSTQTVPIILSRKDELVCRIGATPAHEHLPSPILAAGYASQPIWCAHETFASYMDTWRGRRASTDAAKRLSIYRDPLADLEIIEPPENTIAPRIAAATAPSWQITQDHVRHALAQADERFLFHSPMTIEISGRAIPALFVDHHAAHAADVHYQSGLTSSLIITHDGANETGSAGLVCIGDGSRIYPIARPGFWLGGFYNTVAHAVGLNHDAGKLMGLAPYGQPQLTASGVSGSAMHLGNASAIDIGRKWVSHATARAQSLGYDMTQFAAGGHILSPIKRDLAASAHAIFEDNVSAVARQTADAAREAGFAWEGLAVAGGCALSCPTNTRLWREHGRRVFVGPSCDDSGLAVGAALWIHHNVLGHALIPRDPDEPVSAYLGAAIKPADVTAALARLDRSQVEIAEIGATAAEAGARDLAANRIVAWYEGRSEIGPRALGHRSLLCDPRQAANWPRTNTIKGRELWRPFAPAVCREDAARFFSDMPLPSPYMLFTGKVVDRAALPAITHVDGTARVQTTSPANGQYHELLRAFGRIADCPVVLNTSLNGPGEPIVETPEEAVNFFLRTGCEVLYLDGRRVAKRGV